MSWLLLRKRSQVIFLSYSWNRTVKMQLTSQKQPVTFKTQHWPLVLNKYSTPIVPLICKAQPHSQEQIHNVHLH